MRLQNVLALTYGKLVNEPFVNSFQNVAFEAKAVKRGDLFIAFDEDGIEEALLNGAYGVIFDKPTQISDSEIAWIKVNCVDDSLKRLLRFRLIEKEIVAYECNEVILKLALQVVTEPSFIAITGEVKSMAKALWNADSNSTVLFCPTLSDSEVFTDVKELPKTAMLPINVIEKTLFETSFIYDDVFYERQLISPFFMPFLEKLLHLFKSLNINFRLRRFTPIEHFEAVFTNKNFELKEFGASDKVLIFEKNVDLIKVEMEFLKQNANWAKIAYVVPFSNDNQSDDEVFYYKNPNEIIDELKKRSFHFALIAGVDKSILTTQIANQTQLTLDF